MPRPDFDDEVHLLPYDEDSPPFGIDIEIDENEEKVIIQDIKAYMSFCDTARDAEYWPDIWDACDNLYEGRVEFTDYPFEGCSNLSIPMAFEKVQMFLTKADQQIFSKPFILLKPKPGAGGDVVDALERKEVWLNWKLYDEIDIEVALNPILLDCANKGTGFAKVNWDTWIEAATKCERYTKKDIDKFVDRFEKQKDSEVYKKNYKRLLDGETVRAYVSRLELVWDRPMVHWVPLKNLHIHPRIPLREHRAIGEDREVTWQELVIRSTGEDAEYDIKVIEGIEREYGYDKIKEDEKQGITPEFKKKMHKIVESRYLYNYDGRGEKKCLVTFLDEKNKILKIKTYPYEHNLIDYVPYRMLPKPGCNYGDGISFILRHLNKALNELWNATINSGYWNNAPTFKAIKDANFGNATIQKWGPAYVWWVKDIKQVEQFPINKNSVDMYHFIELILRQGDLSTGISDLSSGKESPMDPQAPAQKVAMLLQESLGRIMRGIKEIHRSNQTLVEIIDKLYQQYYKFEMKDKYYDKDNNVIDATEEGAGVYTVKVGEESFNYEGKDWNITEDDLFTECQYIANLSPLTVNKGLQHQLNENTIAFSAKMFPQIYQKKMMKMAEIYYRGAPGEWQNYAKDLIPEEKTPEQAPEQPPAPETPPVEGAPGMEQEIPKEFLAEETQGKV